MDAKIVRQFWANVEKIPLVSCWIWTGFCNAKGYGLKSWPIPRGDKPQTSLLAHRVSWMIHRGKIPDGLKVLHTCDNPPCCNPEHLFLGTDGDNARDRDQKGRAADKRGINNGRARLTEDDVRFIRGQLAAGVSGAELARQFGVKKETVYAIAIRKNWKHLP